MEKKPKLHIARDRLNPFSQVSVPDTYKVTVIE